MARSAIIAALLLFGFQSEAFGQSWNPGKTGAASQLIQNMMFQRGVPSSAVSIAIGGQVVFGQGFGYLSDGSVPTPDTPYEIGSVSKQFTAAGILALQEDGVVIVHSGAPFNVDSTLDNYFLGIDHWNRPGDPMTIRRLLTMTSNLPSHTNGLAGLSPQDPVPAQALLPAIKALQLNINLPRRFLPPHGFDYSNTNYFLLAQIIDITTGNKTALGDYRAYLQNRIFARAGLANTGFISTTPLPVNRQAAPNMSTGDWSKGAGEMTSTANDLARWDYALFTGKILGQQSLQEMLQPAAGMADGAGSYAMGWMVTPAHGAIEYRHGGEISGFNSFNLVVMPNEGGPIVSVTMLTDKDGVGHDLERVSRMLGQMVFQ